MAGNEWRETTVGALCDEGILHTQTGPFGSQLHSYDYVPIGIPVVPTEGIGRRRLLTEGIPEVGEETAARLSRHRLKSGDILFARRGVQATGLSAIVTPKQEGWICGTGAILLRTLGDSIHPEFLSFLLSSDESIQWLKQHAVGAVMPNLNEGVIRQLPLTLPPLAEQKAIAAVLGALDDKIELNRRMNATLEAMARALFQSWFVDFDPVRAKLDGRPPAALDPATVALDPATVALFPEHLEDSPLGHIPKGWKCGTIGELAARILDKVDDPADWASEPLIDLSRMPQRSVALGEWGRGAELTTSVTRFLPKDVLFGAIRPYFHKVGIAPVSGVTNVSVFVVRARKSFDWPFLAALCSLDSTVEFATRVSKGTKMPVVGWPDFSNFPVVLPPEELRQKFAEAVAPLYEGIFANLHQSRTLATLRDTLLPKLLSGELSIN
jgi:type I restriction enzyme S subunit